MALMTRAFFVGSLACAVLACKPSKVGGAGIAKFSGQEAVAPKGWVEWLSSCRIPVDEFRSVQPAASERTAGTVFLASDGDAAQAMADGVVVALLPDSHFGNAAVAIRHKAPNGDSFVLLYGDLEKSSLESLKVDQEISQGEKIGVVATPLQIGKPIGLAIYGFSDMPRSSQAFLAAGKLRSDAFSVREIENCKR
jgi:hypothetical protein